MNPVETEVIKLIRFLIFVIVVGMLGYVFVYQPCIRLYDRWLCKKARVARQKAGTARLEWLLQKRKIY